MTGYARARPSAHWLDWPDTTYGVVGSAEFSIWDQAIFDLKNEGLRANDFAGVDPTGVADSTTGIAAALAAADAASSPTRLIFNGTYSVSSINFDGVSDVWCDFRTSTIKKNTDSGTALLRNKGGATANYGACSNLVLTGGIIDPNAHQTGNGIVGLAYVEGLVIDGMTVLHTQPSNFADWAFQIGGRKGCRVTNCRVIGGQYLFQDGIHVIHGQDWLIANNYVESGDDAIVLGGLQADARLVAHPDSIRRVTVTNNVVNSQKGYGFRVFVDSGSTGTNWEVTDVTVQGLVGQAGVLRNGGINISDTNGSGAGTSQVKRVKVRGVELAVGSSSHDDVGDPEGILIASVSDVSIYDVSMTLTSASSPTTGFQFCSVANSEDVTLERLACDALGKRYGIAVSASNRVDIVRPKLRCTSASTNGQIFLSGVNGFSLDRGKLLDIPSGINAITLSASLGKTTRGTISGTKFAQLTSGGVGIFASNTAAYNFLALLDNDFISVSAPLNPSTMPAGRSSTINHGGGYLSTDTAFSVVDGSQFQFEDLIYLARTGEAMRVTSVVTNTVNVSRHQIGTTAAAILNGDTLLVQNMLVRGNRGLADSVPVYA